MANESSNGSVIGVDVNAIESERCVERLGSRGISRSKSNDHSLSSCDGILGSLVGTADVGHLVVDAVGDDGWVEGLLLSLVDLRILGLEGAGGGSTAVKSELELHGWGADTKVKTGDGGGLETGESTSDRIGDCSESSSWCRAD